MPRATNETSRSTRKTKQRRERREELAAATSLRTKRTTGRSTTTETPLHVRALGVAVDAQLDAYVRKRVGFKLGKFATHVNRATVRFADLSGPKGAKTYACRFKVLLAVHGSVVLEARGAEPRAVFDTGIDAVERAVRRLVVKRRSR